MEGFDPRMEGYDPRIEAAFPGDAFAQAIAATIASRGNLTMEQAIAAVEARYDYDMIGRVIDEIEDSVPSYHEVSYFVTLTIPDDKENPGTSEVAQGLYRSLDAVDTRDAVHVERMP